MTTPCRCPPRWCGALANRRSRIIWNYDNLHNLIIPMAWETSTPKPPSEPAMQDQRKSRQLRRSPIPPPVPPMSKVQVPATGYEKRTARPGSRGSHRTLFLSYRLDEPKIDRPGRQRHSCPLSAVTGDHVTSTTSRR